MKRLNGRRVIEHYLFKFQSEVEDWINYDSFDLLGKERLRDRLRVLVTDVHREMTDILDEACGVSGRNFRDGMETLDHITKLAEELRDFYAEIREEECEYQVERWNTLLRETGLGEGK